MFFFQKFLRNFHDFSMISPDLSWTFPVCFHVLFVCTTLFSYDTYIEVAFTHTTISSYHLDISCTCITIITIIILMNMNFQQYHASVHATMQPRYPMHMQNNHIIIIILQQQCMQVCIHQQHMQCVYHAYVLVCFSQCATLSPNGPHGVIDVPKGKWEERTNCQVTLQSASMAIQGCPALQFAINSSLRFINSPFVCFPLASLTLAIKVCHTCTPKGSFS